jgi:Lrp/AsnC family leucine-responsive transcriptional regulator
MSKYPDSIDKKILSLLEQNARISNAELAEKVNLSPTPCLRRLRKLEDSGLIRGYGAVLNEKALGLHASALVFVNLDKNTKENAERFEAALKLLPEVMECFLVAGRHDYVLRVVTRDLDDYERFIKERLAVLEKIADLESIIILKQTLFRKHLPIPH